MLVLNEDTFAENTSEGLVLVDFFTVWCGPCKVLAPVLEEIEGIKVCKVDVEENRDLGVRFAVSGVPCLVFLRDGVEVDRITGLASKAAIQLKVDQLNAETA
jgi:thioredoxin 1